MEIAKYLCEFFFCDWVHYLQLVLIFAVASSSSTVNIRRK